MADIFFNFKSAKCANARKESTVTVFDVRDEIQGLRTKLDLQARRVHQRIHANFPGFDDWKVNKSHNFSDLEVEICQYLAVFKSDFNAYFDGAIFNNDASWITHPFKAKLESIADDNLCKDELINPQSLTALHSTFISCNGGFSKFFNACLLNAEHERDSTKKLPASWLVSLGKALNGVFPSLYGRKMMGPNSLTRRGDSVLLKTRKQCMSESHIARFAICKKENNTTAHFLWSLPAEVAKHKAALSVSL